MMRNIQVRHIFGTPNHPGVGGFLLGADIFIETYFVQVDFWETRGSKPAALRAQSGPFLARNRQKKSILPILTTSGWKSGFKGLSGRFSEWRGVLFSISLGAAGDPGAPEAVTGAQSGEANAHQKHP